MLTLKQAALALSLSALSVLAVGAGTSYAEVQALAAQEGSLEIQASGTSQQISALCDTLAAVGTDANSST